MIISPYRIPERVVGLPSLAEVRILLEIVALIATTSVATAILRLWPGVGTAVRHGLELIRFVVLHACLDALKLTSDVVVETIFHR